MLSQSLTVGASIQKTDVYCTDGLGGYTLFLWKNSSQELGNMHLYKSNGYGYNTYTASYESAPIVYVATSKYYLDGNYNGSLTSYLSPGQKRTISCSCKSNSDIYGCAKVQYI